MTERHINSYTPEERRQIMVNRLRQIVVKRDGSFDEDAYVNKRTPVKFKCSYGHEWESQAQTVLHGSWCRQCWDEKHAGKHLRLKDGLEQAKEIAAKQHGECLSTKYITGITPLHWKCQNGHEWHTGLSDIKKGTWCPECGSGVRERLCRHYFEKITGQLFPKSKPKWLINSLGNRMELDGYCEEIGIAFEHQGEQHYRKVAHFNRRDETLARRIVDDAQKRNLCLEKRISLIEVPFHIPKNELSTYIFNHLKNLSLSLQLVNLDTIARLEYVPSTELHELKKIAKARGGECLSNVYLGVLGKHRFRCSKGHEWEATAVNVKSRTWCPTCKPERIGNSNRKYSVESMSKIAEKHGGKFISEIFKSVNFRYSWRCKLGHEWLATPTDIMKGTWCRLCANNSQKGSIEEMQNIAEFRGGICLSEVYLSSQTKLKWRCILGHEWEARPDNVKNSKSWCPICARKNCQSFNT